MANQKSSNQSLTDFFKPQYTDAIYRLRNSLLALLALLTLTHLLPIPALYTSIWRLYFRSFRSTLDKTFAYLELGAAGLLLLNAAQATWAIKYPRSPYPPIPSPAKAQKSLQAASPAPSWRKGSNALSPNTTPQRQLPFSSPASDPRNLAQSYSLSFPPPSPDASFASSISVPPSPSPSSPLAAYRGRRGAGVGRALDRSLLTRLSQAESDSDES
ncbi:hypothetical protein DENSPDRAFT_835742 [Dentipellis sp. KUC8613]|nr:hypothetical protein DENSPDRAFT_835742 [Dentipellis sp. KUC8613]